jgi:hypothetical protein
MWEQGLTRILESLQTSKANSLGTGGTKISLFLGQPPCGGLSVFPGAGRLSQEFHCLLPRGRRPGHQVVHTESGKRLGDFRIPYVCLLNSLYVLLLYLGSPVQRWDIPSSVGDGGARVSNCLSNRVSINPWMFSQTLSTISRDTR